MTTHNAPSWLLGSGYPWQTDTASAKGVVFDNDEGLSLEGAPEDSDTSVESGEDTPKYVADGWWQTGPLDSGIYNCQWHRLAVTFGDLPPGTEVELKTYSSAKDDQAPVSPRDPRWVAAYTFVAALQAPPETETAPQTLDVLIPSRPGQYLSVGAELRGDTFVTPVVQSIRVHYPRESFLGYLPPLYSANEPMRAFLESFLGIVQTSWEDLESRVDESAALFDPDAVPSGTAMTYLASWIGLELEGQWTGEQNRRLLNAARVAFPRRGTLEALRGLLAAYLSGMTGAPTAAALDSGFPAIVEGFRERQYLLLSHANGSTLGSSKPLWSDEVVRRLQLGGLSREGDVELVSTGDPEHDFFNYFAHRFRVYLPASWVRSKDDERLLRRAIESEMPAHLTYDLCLVHPGVRVDIQSTVGVDTILGDLPPWRLPRTPDDVVPGRELEVALGHGTTLSAGHGTRPATLDRTAHVGVWTLE